eukprot:428191-Rhodomonas_salina.1
MPYLSTNHSVQNDVVPQYKKKPYRSTKRGPTSVQHDALSQYDYLKLSWILWSAISLRASYAMSGTDLACGAISLGACYAMSGTDLAYGGTSAAC